MPLEQIRSVAALNSSESLRRASYMDYPSSSTGKSSYTRDDDGSDSDKEDGDDGYFERIKRASTSSQKSESMSLTKLGGVGGVTRSGSWGHNALPHNSPSSRQDTPESRPSLYHSVRSSLSRYQEEAEEQVPGYTDGAEDKMTSGLPTASNNIGKSIPQGSERDAARSSRCAEQTSTLADASGSSNAPTSSRTSTASSAAAFSLRSLSNRNSTGSVSSITSVLSRGELDRLTPAPPAESPMPMDDPLAVKSDSEPTITSSSSSASVTAPSSPTRSKAAHRDMNPSSEDSHQNQTPSSSQQAFGAKVTSIIATSPSPPTQSHRILQATAADDEPGTQLLYPPQRSPPPQTQPPQTQPRQLCASPPSQGSLQPSAEELLSTAATSMYTPLLPRRHSGAIMLRSRSQLAMHSGLAMIFANADGGRAAARERARKQTGWENAPFSVLEAQRHAPSFAYSQPASPGALASPVSWDFPAPSTSLQPAAAIAEAAPVPSPQMSARPLDRSQSSPLASPSLQPPNKTNEAAVPRPPLPARQKSEHTLSHAALARIDTVLGYYGSDAAELPLASPGDTASGSKTAPLRSPSGSVILGPNSVLRTPTTEEWSRYLESQGVGLIGRRSRTGTGISAGSAQRPSRLAMSSFQASSKADLDAARDFGDDSDLESDDSDDHDLGVEVLEKLKQLGISRAASRAGSVLGDELASLHEEDEDELSPVSPQVDQIARADPTLLTPIASGIKALPSADYTPTSLSVSSPGTSQPPLDRGITVRLPRSKRPTVSGDVQGSSQLYPQDYEGQKGISDFEIVSDVGRGAYGLVKKARRKGPDGRPQGDEVVIKYIIKSRILADCWRRHRVLGPIPVEIHVMDQLRRIVYVPPRKPRPWAPKRPKTLEEYRAQKRLDAEHEEASALLSAPAPIATSNSHPNICKMLDFFEDYEFYYLVMPCFGRGQDLFDYVESAPDGLAASQCRSIFGQVADALWFLHANNIVHRDIKDENVILDGEGNAQLIDFGSAAHVRPGKLFDTFSGTLDYAAAEILQGEKYAGQAQDIWALGVVGFVLLCGECPFWNGEEAVQGLEEGTRAAQTLKERCMIARRGVPDIDKDLADQDLDMAPLDPAWSRCKDKEGAEPDGGGRIDDFVDLITRCLELDPEARPSAEQICQHRFLVGYGGWTGHLGWLRLRAPLVPSCTIKSEGKVTASAASLATLT